MAVVFPFARPDWAELERRRRSSTSGWRTCRSPSRARSRSASRSSRDELDGARPRLSRCTSTCRTSGSRPTARRPSPSPSIWRTRGSRGSRKRRCSKSRAASTSGACASCATRRATRSTTPSACGCAGSAGAMFGLPTEAVSGVLHAEAVQQELRAAPRRLVRAEPPRRGLRRDVRRLADADERVAAALRRLAGAQEARVHGRADGVAPPAAAARRSTPTKSIRCASCARRCGSTTATSAGTTASTIRTSTTATCGGCSRKRRSSPTT